MAVNFSCLSSACLSENNVMNLTMPRISHVVCFYSLSKMHVFHLKLCPLPCPCPEQRMCIYVCCGVCWNSGQVRKHRIQQWSHMWWMQCVDIEWFSIWLWFCLLFQVSKATSSRIKLKISKNPYFLFIPRFLCCSRNTEQSPDGAVPTEPCSPTLLETSVLNGAQARQKSDLTP